MFLGEFHHSLDDKGRLTLPARWREQLGFYVVITRGYDNCLFVFPGDKFERIAQAMNEAGFERADARALSRYFFARATDVEPDKQGRIIISSTLRDYARIENEAVIIGVNERIEIWNPERYQEADSAVETDAAAVSERMAEIIQRALVQTR